MTVRVEMLDIEANHSQPGNTLDIQIDSDAEALFSRGRVSLKAIEDFTLAIIGFVLFLPASLLIALAIKLESRGPVFVRQRCQGRDGRIFELLRFRTMRGSEDSGLSGRGFRGDQGVTRVGWFLCSTALLELPQLLNVLRGDMSIVGPNPHSRAHSRRSRNLIAAYPNRLRVKPGMTGWAQVHGLGGEKQSPEVAGIELRYDLEYADTWSVWLDFKIIAATLFPHSLVAN